jgi:hypothetical protein
MTKTGSQILRWLVLIFIITNIVFNGIYDKLLGLNSITDVTVMYISYFTPAGYAFSIWGLIYLSLIIYSIAQLLPANRNIHLFDRIAIPVIIVNFLASFWVLVFVSDLIIISMGTILLMLFISAFIFKVTHEAVIGSIVSSWTIVPFSLLFGWLTVASLANLSLWLVANGIPAAGQEPAIIILFILVAALIGVLICIKSKDYIYPLVIAWAGIAIWVARKNDQPAIALTALSSAIALIILAVIIGFRKK